MSCIICKCSLKKVFQGVGHSFLVGQSQTWKCGRYGSKSSQDALKQNIFEYLDKTMVFGFWVDDGKARYRKVDLLRVYNSVELHCSLNKLEYNPHANFVERFHSMRNRKHAVLNMMREVAFGYLCSYALCSQFVIKRYND